jgi:hypothetical protein
MRTKCWANKSLVVAVTEAMAGVSARVSEGRSKSRVHLLR